MNKTAIKNFAIWARNKLIADITYKASLLGITDKEIKSPLPQSTKDVQFFDIGTKEPYSISGVEINQRKKLAEEIQRKARQTDYKTAYTSVVEEVAYTWFNRLIAVRFMEVNDYLPSRIRVLSSESNTKIEPDLVTSPFNADLTYSPYEKDRIMQQKNDNQLDELFRMLFIKQCNALNTILPNLFEKTNDYTELLMNVSFTDKDGVVYHLVHDIPEDDFNVEKEGQVEIIGWMYQYYNTEPKDETFALLKKNVKITKERIPAATQLFTPDWIVRYMVENSLGRLWLEREWASSGLSHEYLNGSYFGWKYYLEEAEQEPEVEAQLAKIREEYKAIKPEDIKVIDPCMGSGHILVYAFDVLMGIYESCGYSQRDAAKSIVENNLYGLDIDNRAYQLAYFAVMMKARQYNRRILNGETVCHVYSIQESNGINREQLKYFGVGMGNIEQKTALRHMEYLLDIMRDAKEYGSILNIENLNWSLLNQFVANSDNSVQMTLDAIGLDDTQVKLRQLLKVAEVMAHKYDVVVTNPPYMGSSGMGVKLSDFVKKHYPDSKSDLFAVFIERCGQMTKKNCYQAMLTQHVWMFLSSFEKLRAKILLKDTVNMAHLGARAFDEIGGEVVQATSFVLRNCHLNDYQGSYTRLVDYGSQQEKEAAFLAKQDIYPVKQENFTKVPGQSIAYWVSESVLNLYDYPPIRSKFSAKEGVGTRNDDVFLRMFWEVPSLSIGKGKRWILTDKAGAYRKWYLGVTYVMDWENDGFRIRNYRNEDGSLRSRPQNLQYLFMQGISWGKVGSGATSFRFRQAGYGFNDAAPTLFGENELPLLGIMNSKVFEKLLKIRGGTMNMTCGVIEELPLLGYCGGDEQKRIEKIVSELVEVSKHNWNSFETSWEFCKHPFLVYKTGKLLKEAFNKWNCITLDQFNLMKADEEELNRIFIKIYGFQNELTPEVPNDDVTIRKAEPSRDIHSFISYAVGCMFGRYSLDVDGLAYAGGEWDDSKYSTFIPDTDNILPITDDEYFEDDILGLFCTFLKKTFGSEALEENLDFIAKALGNKGNSSREVIRNYFLKDFFNNHCKVYRKRPIYWLFDSGKVDGFKALVYMHRYNVNTIGNLRIDYLHRMQRVYDSEIARMQETMENSDNAREVAAAIKRKEKLTKQLKEAKEYDEKIAHLALARIGIELDDGVKFNYEKVQTGTDGKKLEVLAKI